MNALVKTSAWRILSVLIIGVPECLSSRMEDPVSPSHRLMQEKIKDNYTSDSAVSSLEAGKQMMQSSSRLPTEDNTSLPILVNTKVVLSCPPVAYTDLIIITWKIMPRDKPPCSIAYRKDRNETTGNNCNSERRSWASRPDQKPELQIDPVAITDDGYYLCELVTPDANFHRGSHLYMLVPPEVTLFRRENRTAVCKADAGKPAAQISWTPEGVCVPEEESWENGTVTVLSTCHWEGSNVSPVTCSVSHVTGNKTLTLELHPSLRTSGSPVSALLIIIYWKLSLLLVLVVIVGFLYFQKINGCRA
ncbi:cell surface glycoprotein CD200 receptor 2-like [Dasypus novemcinctus]|uniref:cell surface glycoprotein CD200 receptor 2-like n=1 Tax=Dasypus novemcinctus TaxID=9361 RepID=UPI0026604699|nr:cell surface glycoprotein CD200 receptor 2-like [Dasypus novemcinctus]